MNLDNYFIHTYNRFPVVMDYADGVYIYDENGKKYLDAAAGIGVCSLGYGHEGWKTAITDQLDKITHTSNLFYNMPSVEAAEKLANATGLKKVFFTNSGAEAVEGALKMARRYGDTRREVIAMEQSFHGRTMGALALTGNEAYQTPFKPMIGGVKFAKFNDLESVREKVSAETCAIIVEPIQGEGGVTPATEEFMKGIRELCDEKDILMICDEIQCGMGRTGKMFAYEHYDVKPDIVTCAKALGCGVPVGAFVAGEKCMDSLVPGDHGTTYGGNPLVTAAVSAVLDIYKEEKIVENAKEVGDYLAECLNEIVETSDKVDARKGMGMMQGLVLNIPVGDVVSKAIEEGVLVISAGGNVLRMLPPLVFTKENVDELVEVLNNIL
ncbi:MAG: aspartate aminotransferase family protein [Eubacterium sp.]|nr:aspartate aminotransferase family protein [Eubacterium sp.]